MASAAKKYIQPQVYAKYKKIIYYPRIINTNYVFLTFVFDLGFQNDIHKKNLPLKSDGSIRTEKLSPDIRKTSHGGIRDNRLNINGDIISYWKILNYLNR